MHNITKLGVGAVAAVLLGACGSSDSSSNATPTTKVATPTTVTSAAAPTTTVKTAGPTTTADNAGPTTTIKAGATTTTGAASSSGKVDLASISLGKVLVDSEGRTLYLYTKDTQNQPSTCVGSCATTWLPEIASGTPTAGTGLEASKLAESKRADGTEQLTYNGWPLYRNVKDTKAGDDTGEGLDSSWFAVDAAGNAVHA
jgi:predicted lipoprotein with Yx(FWY)xxD motif